MKFLSFSQTKLGSSLSLPAHGRAGARATPFLAALFAKKKTKFGGGGKARAGKNSFPPTPFLFARPSENYQKSASGFSLKKVRILFRRDRESNVARSYTATRSLRTLGSQLGLRPFSYTREEPHTFLPTPPSVRFPVTRTYFVRAAGQRIEPQFHGSEPCVLLHPAKFLLSSFLRRAAGPGIEPRFHGSEPCVLPLDDPAALRRKRFSALPPCQDFSCFSRTLAEAIDICFSV